MALNISLKKPTKIVAAVLGVLTLIVLILIFVTTPKEQPQPGPTASPVAQLQLSKIHPGTASESDVFAKLGQPLNTQPSGTAANILSYPSYNQYNPNEVTVADGKVSFIRERLYDAPDTSLKSRLRILGEDYAQLYGPDSNSGVILFTYPEKGLAFFANPIGDVIFEVWYFPKGDLEQTLSLPEFADYSTQEYYTEEL